MTWFRLLWMFFTARFRSRVPLDAEFRVSFRCMPTDCDLNVHMTNSRYLVFMDLVRFELLLRSNEWRAMRKEGIGPVVGSSAIRFRRQVRPFQKFEVSIRTLSWDDRWIYLEHKLLSRGEVYSMAIVKVAFVNKNGRIPAERFAAITANFGKPPPISAVADAHNALDKLMSA